jgi:putative protein-disulfide isomerase
MTAAIELVYFADPMCSWCYGFSPVIAALAERLRGRLPLRLVMGGLRPGTREALAPAEKDVLGKAWLRVAAATGQAFDLGVLRGQDFCYDTEPACRAVVAVRRTRPQLALCFMARLQRAFYAENRDITCDGTIAAVAAEAGLARQEFSDAFEAAATRNETFRDFLSAQELGIRGFPTLIAGGEATGYILVSSGYRPLTDLLAPLEHWLAAGAPVSTPSGGDGK